MVPILKSSLNSDFTVSIQGADFLRTFLTLLVSFDTILGLF